jgi:hypothetical protein
VTAEYRVAADVVHRVVLGAVGQDALGVVLQQHRATDVEREIVHGRLQVHVTSGFRRLPEQTA